MVDPLAASSPLDPALRAALPAPTAALSVRVVEGVRMLVLRHAAGGHAALEAALAGQGLSPLPQPGTFHGSDPWLLWAGPAECLLFTSHAETADGVLQALAPGQEALACAVDATHGCLVLELQGPGVGAWLARLVDASALPQGPGQGGRVRWMDIRAVLMRLAPDRVWLTVDRPQGLYAARWLAQALAGAANPG
jgi:sarcosine oxidase gamma subunit